jgi:nicotinamidase-related amidase
MAPAPRSQALLILDMLSEFHFPGWRKVLAEARRIAPAIARLRQRASKAGIPVIYVNDTAGEWESDQTEFVRRCGKERARGRDIAELLRPRPGDYFIFKPRHSGFYSTPLATLLELRSVEELIFTGTTSHQCVLFTAMDAYVRDYRIVVPADCIGAPTPAQTRQALFILKESLRARTPPSARLKLAHSRGATRRSSIR